MVFLVRKSSGEVLGVSTDPATYAGIDATFMQTVADPPTPNGLATLADKIWDGTSVRDATAPELATFPTAQASDLNLQQRAAAILRLQVDPVLRKVLRAIVGQLIVQLNVVRQNPTTVFAAITEAQAETAIVNAINAGTFD